jgi:hypothetical protein
MRPWKVVPLPFTAALLAASCHSAEEKARGQLMVAIQADMPLPKEVDDVRVEVLVDGEIRFANDYPVGKDYLKLPATVAITSENPSAPVTVRVIGKKGTKARTLREAVTTIPTDRLATLRMPIQWLCDDSVKGDGNDLSSTCDAGQTCHEGSCVDSQVKQTDLPVYDPTQVFGGGDETGTTGSCFDTVPCMLAGVTASVDQGCTLQAPNPAVNVNVALRVPTGGICDDGGINCFVPLDQGAEGWDIDNGVIKLPTAACDRLKDGRVRSIVVSTTCPTKTPKTPTCGPWSSIATSETPTAVAPPTPTVLATVPSTVAPDAAVCCPLMLDNGDLYTCVCRPGLPSMTVVATNAGSGAVRTVATVPLLGSRTLVPAVTKNGALFFTDRDTTSAVSQSVLKRVSLDKGQTGEVSRANGDVFDDSSLLIDDTSVYALGNVQVGKSYVVNVLVFPAASGTSSAIATGSTKAAFEFTQDATSLYIAAIDDDGAPPATWNRTSRIVKIDKTTHSTSDLQKVTVQTTSINRGGFFGLQLGDGVLFATEEGNVLADGTYHSKFVEVKLADPTTPPTPILDQLLKVDQTENKPLGVVGALLYTLQQELDPTGAIQASSISTIDPSGGPSRALADFVGDAPLAVGAGVIDSGGFVYWMNRSGRIFELAHATK